MGQCHQFISIYNKIVRFFARLLLQLIPAHSHALRALALSLSIYCYFYGVQLFDFIVVAVMFIFVLCARGCFAWKHWNLGLGKHRLQFVSLHAQYLKCHGLCIVYSRVFCKSRDTI